MYCTLINKIASAEYFVVKSWNCLIEFVGQISGKSCATTEYFHNASSAPAGQFLNDNHQNKRNPCGRYGDGLRWGIQLIEGDVRDLRDLWRVHQGLGAVTQPHAVDPQGEDPPQDDLQSAPSQLPKVPVPVLHRPGLGATSPRLTRSRHQQHAGGSQQEQGRRTVSCLRQGEFAVIGPDNWIGFIRGGFVQVYQWKLLNHVARDHNMTLKPAHLSYKCTVCTATFGMYKQFENHVYSAHSVVAKRVMEKKSSAAAQASGAATISSSSVRGANDSLLKPLKINDEITIIPQPTKSAKAGSTKGASSSDRGK